MASDRLIYGENIGCVSHTSANGGTPGQCGRGEEFAVPHRYRYPRPHDTRLYVCAIHAADEPDAEPLHDTDRHVIEARHRRRDEQLAPVRRARRAAANANVPA